MKHQSTWLAEEVGKQPTFWGAYLCLREKLVEERDWNATTTEKYESSIIKLICSHLKNHNQTPVSEYSRKDFEMVIQRIAKAGYEKEKGVISKYESSTLGHFLSLIRIVVSVAARHYYFEDVFAQPPEATAKKRKNLPEKKHMVPGFLSVEAEIRLGEALLNDPMQSGQLMGLAGMLCWGGRNAESTGMNFGDLKLWRKIPGCWVVWVYKTTMIDSNVPQSSGKTRNADRVVLLPSRYVKLVLERKQMLQNLLGDTVDVDALPVACRGDNYFERCSADDLTDAARTLFAQVGISRDQIRQAYEEMLLSESEMDDPLERLNCDLLDCTSPTAYFLRHVYGTSLACVGLTEKKIAFQIGHDMGGPRETRNEFLNTKMLLEIKEKIDRRAVVNVDTGEEGTVCLDRNQVWESFPSGTTEFRLPEGTSCIHLRLTAREPLDDIRIGVSLPDGEQKAQMTGVQFGVTPGRDSEELDIGEDYNKLYKKQTQN